MTIPPTPAKAKTPTPTYKFTISAMPALAQRAKKAHFFQKNRKHTQTKFDTPRSAKR